MNSSLDWAKLYNEGRCQDIGVPFNNEERNALHNLNIPVEYVRMGIITLDDYSAQLKKEAETGKKPLEKMKDEDLIEIAKRLDVKLTPDIPKSVLITEIRRKKEILESKAKQQKLVAKAKENVENEIKAQKEKDSKELAKEEANKTKKK